MRPVSLEALLGVMGAPPAVGFSVRGGILLGDGGPEFFASAADFLTDGIADPLDRFTEHVVTGTAVACLEPAGIRYQLLFPFRRLDDGRSFVPFQRLGEAAGLPAPGPLGLQIHPSFGPWWGYRAAIVVDETVDAPAALASPCLDCAGPCVAACPGSAVHQDGFNAIACFSHRSIDEGCQTACRARSACPVGAAQRYPDGQLAYHMRAALLLSCGRR